MSTPDKDRADFEASVRATMHDAGEEHIAERLACWPDGAYKDRSTGYAWWGYQQAVNRIKTAQAGQDDKALLDFLQDECLDLCCFTSSDGEDVYWKTISHHMGEPRERVASQVYGDDPRKAIREAIARLQRDPHCTGPLHEEDESALQFAESTP